MRVQVIAKWKRSEVLPSPALGFTRVAFLLLGDKQSGVGLRELLDELRSRRWPVPEVAIDLASIAFSVYSADMGVPRSISQDSWTREILIEIPVFAPLLWDGQTAILTRLLNYLTGDRWFFRFRARPAAPEYNVNVDPSNAEARPGIIALFSGGLDSCVGAIDALATGVRLLCVSHAGDGVASGAQKHLVQTLDAVYPDQISHLRFWYTPRSLFKGMPTEKTTRGRSFLFFAAAVAAASTQAADGALIEVQIPENGFISINVPLDPLRLGSHSTRTTHPYVLRLWNELLQQISMSVALANPYQFMTKGEMFLRCANKRLLKKLLTVTMSCSSPTKARWQQLPPQHCGHCVPCIIRHAALRKAFGTDPTKYTVALRGKLDPTTAEGRNVRAFQRAIHVNNHVHVARIVVHSSGPLERDARFSELYIRGLKEVKRVVSRVRT